MICSLTDCVFGFVGSPTVCTCAGASGSESSFCSHVNDTKPLRYMYGVYDKPGKLSFQAVMSHSLPDFGPL